MIRVDSVQWIHHTYPVRVEEKRRKEGQQCVQKLFCEGEVCHEAVARGKSGVEGVLLSLLFLMEVLEQDVFQTGGFDPSLSQSNGW